jgi:hypothetical protein
MSALGRKLTFRLMAGMGGTLPMTRPPMPNPMSGRHYEPRWGKTVSSTLHFQNRSETSVELIVEPVADRYVVEAGQGVSISYAGDTRTPLEIEYHSSGNLALWTHAPTQVFGNGKLLVAF